MKQLILPIAVLILGILGSGHSVAQDMKVLDSLHKIGTLEIYEHPDVSIRIGQQIYDRSGDNLRIKINALIMISDAYASKRDYQKSLHYATQAKKLSQQTDNTIMKIKILLKTATQSQQLKIYDRAIEDLDEADRISQSYPYKDSIRYLLGNSNVIRGFIYKEQLNCDIAIGYFDKGIAEYNEINTAVVYPNLSIVTYNKGNCYIQLSDYEAAKKCFSEAARMAKSIDAKSLHAFALKGLAEVYTLEGKYREAIAQLTEAEKMSTDVGDLVLNQGIYKGLSENYLAINEWGNFRKFQQRYLETQQQIKISERKSVSESLDEQEKNLYAKLAKVKWFYLFGILALIILSFAVVMLFVFYDKKTRKKMVILQKTIKELQQDSPKSGTSTSSL